MEKHLIFMMLKEASDTNNKEGIKQALLYLKDYLSKQDINVDDFDDLYLGTTTFDLFETIYLYYKTKTGIKAISNCDDEIPF